MPRAFPCGRHVAGAVDVYPGKKEAEPVSLSTEQVKRVLGVDFGREQIAETLTSLGFDCQTTINDAELLVTAPYWRSDIRITEDLVEDVARIRGYDKIPTTMLSQPIPRQAPLAMLKLKRELRACLTGYGFQELLTPSLVGMETLQKLTPDASEPQALRLANPMTSDQEYLRPTLRASLLGALAANQRFEDGSIRLAEISHTFVARSKDLPDERDTLCCVISGPQVEKWWQGNEAPADFFTAKGIVERLLSRLGVEAGFETGNDAGLHLTSQAAITVKGQKLGMVGEIHPKVRESFEIRGPAYLVEIDLPALLPLVSVTRTYRPIPRFPAVVRDIALVVGVEVTHRQALEIIKSFPLVDSVALFDIYLGEQVPSGKKSLAYRITYQSPGKTLTDEEITTVQQQILSKLAAELGATLRG